MPELRRCPDSAARRRCRASRSSASSCCRHRPPTARNTASPMADRRECCRGQPPSMRRSPRTDRPGRRSPCSPRDRCRAAPGVSLISGMMSSHRFRVLMCWSIALLRRNANPLWCSGSGATISCTPLRPRRGRGSRLECWRRPTSRRSPRRARGRGGTPCTPACSHTNRRCSTDGRLRTRRRWLQ